MPFFDVRTSVAVLLTVLIGACGSDSSAPYLQSCDVRARQCQADIYASLAPLLEADPADVPTIRVISPAELREEIRSGSTPYRLPVYGPEQRAYEVMGLVDRNGPAPADDQLDALVQLVGGYYDDDSKTVVIIDRSYEPGDAQFLLAHELVHAIQDRDFGLPSLTGLDTDAILARRSVPEGDADYFAHDWFYRAEDFELDSYAWGSIAQQRQDSLQALATDRDGSVFDSANAFPYIAGMRVARAAFQAHGFEGRAELFQKPPTTTRNVLFQFYPEVSRSPVPLEDLATNIVPPESYELAATDRLGAWVFYTHLRRAWPEGHEGSLGRWSDEGFFILNANVEHGRSNTRNPHESWREDRLYVYEKGDEVVAVWVVRLEYPEWPPNDGIELAYTLLREGAKSAPWSVRQIGANELALIFADDAATVAAWEAQPIAPSTADAATAAKGLRTETPGTPFCVLTAKRF